MYDLYILKPSVAKMQYSKHLIFREKKHKLFVNLFFKL